MRLVAFSVAVSAVGAAAFCSSGISAAASGGSQATSSSSTAFQVSVEGRTFSAALPASSVGTYVWRPDGPSVESWITTPRGAESAEGVLSQPSIPFTSAGTGPTITVQPNDQAQVIEGFGGAMTESAAYEIQKSSSGAQILEKLFRPRPAGAGLSIVRMPLGPSDFTVKKGGPTEFSLKQDRKYLIPELKAAWPMAGGLKLLATPWSAPGRMKNGGELVGSSVCNGPDNTNDRLELGDYGAYAAYLTKAVADYQQEGLPFWMLSLQNEPHHCDPTYPTMAMEPAEEAALSVQVYNALRSAGSGLTSAPPKLLGWDHNWSEFNGPTCEPSAITTFPEQLFETQNNIEALGFHGYCGEPKAPAGVPSSIPFYLTESTGTESHPSASEDLPYEEQHYLIDPLREGARGSLYWNLALDEDCGPQFGGLKPKDNCSKYPADGYSGCINCRPMITVKAHGEYTINQDYYYWAQLSAFIRPGARVVASSQVGELDSVAAENPDGTIVLVVLNAAPTTGVWTAEPLASATGGSPVWPASVSCASPTMCMAVGRYQTKSNGVHGDAEVWNGAGWSVKPFEGAVERGASVACPNMTSCVAVGERSGGGAISEVWDGSKWRSYDMPGGEWGRVASIACSSPSYCEAVGFGAAGVEYPIADHWDGTSWTEQSPLNPYPSESTERGNTSFRGVACVAATTTCMAVGELGAFGAEGQNPTLGELWNGSSWSITPRLYLPDFFYSFNAASCVSTAECLAVGEWTTEVGVSGPIEGTLAERWNGATWEALKLDGAIGGDVTCTSRTFCLSVYGGFEAIWNGAKWHTELEQEASTGSGPAQGTAASCVTSTFCMEVDAAQAGAAYVRR